LLEIALGNVYDGKGGAGLFIYGEVDDE